MTGIKDIYQHYLSASGVTTDSRNIHIGNLFFALRGDHFDGNKFAAQALDMGASIAIIDNKDYQSDDRCILVEDSLSTLQELARYHRKTLNIPFIGLTGTNGKTTTKELIHRVLSQKYNTHATKGNFNNHIGVPLTILDIRDEAEIAVIEMGANHQGEIAMLSEITDPDYGIITNIGKAHLEGFGDYEGVIKSKTELYAHMLRKKGTVIVNGDDDLLMQLSTGINRITYGTDNASLAHAKITSSLPFLNIQWKEHLIKTHLYGEYNFENVMAALCVGLIFDVKPDEIARALSDYIPDNNRSQMIKSGTRLIFMDAYNANPSSMIASIRNFEKQEAANKVLILGDMLELGESSGEEHRNIILELEGKFDLVILIGNEFIKSTPPPSMKTFTNTVSAAEWLKQHTPSDSSILLKGSRGMEMELLLDVL
ncbi:MAG: UDP-N-acetylmuramoyl-tripeptide--D-alanyl-D-alanine ligase [Bacteroidota bacterium]